MSTEFRHSFRCTDCGRKFSIRAPTMDLSSEPECPNCAKVLRARGMDVSAGKAPGIRSIGTKAADATAEMTMADYGLTNLRDDTRIGESSAPKLPLHQQQQADAMFSGKPPPASLNPAATAAMRMFDPATVFQTAIGGGYGRPGSGTGPVDIVGATHAAKLRVPVTEMNATDRRVAPPA